MHDKGGGNRMNATNTTRLAGRGVDLFSYSTDHSKSEWVAVDSHLPPTGLENGQVGCNAQSDR